MENRPSEECTDYQTPPLPESSRCSTRTPIVSTELNLSSCFSTNNNNNNKRKLETENHPTLTKRKKFVSDSEVALNLRKMRNYTKHDMAEEERQGVTTQLSLYNPRSMKKMENRPGEECTDYQTPPPPESSRCSTRTPIVSTELSLSSCFSTNNNSNNKRKLETENHPTLPKLKKFVSDSEVALNLRKMRNYTKHDMAEEERQGVTTQLSLYNPRSMKKMENRPGEECTDYQTPPPPESSRCSTRTPIVSKELNLSSCFSTNNNNNTNNNKRKLHQTWSMKKNLMPSDIGNLSRLMLKSDWAKNHFLPHLDIKQVESKDGVAVRVFDSDTHSEHDLAFKLWKSSNSYVFKKGWVQEFVKRRNLKEGDQIGMFCHVPSRDAPPQSMLKIHFCVLKRAQPKQD